MPESNGGFGHAVAANDNSILVGAVTTDLGANGSGAAYLFNRRTGELIRTIRSPNPQSNALFGTEVLFFDDDVIVTTLSTTTGGSKPGVAYVIDGENNSVMHSLRSPSLSTDDAFGTSLAAIGNVIAVSAIVDDSQAINSGVVHLFDGGNGQYLRTLQNPNPKAEDRFGIDLAVDDGYLVVGSTGGITGAGSVYIFDTSSGNLVHQLDNPSPAVDDEFGRAIAVLNNQILVGAPGDDTLGTNVGAVYRFDGLSGRFVGEIENPLPGEGDAFGSEIGVSDFSVAIGAPLKTFEVEPNGRELGAVYVFERNSLQLSSMITPNTPNTQDRFGMSLVGFGSDIIIGHGLDDEGAQDAGSVLVYSIPEPRGATLLVCFAAVFAIRSFQLRVPRHSSG